MKPRQAETAGCNILEHAEVAWLSNDDLGLFFVTHQRRLPHPLQNDIGVHDTETTPLEIGYGGDTLRC